MAMHDYIRFVAAFCLVLGLMGGLALILKRINLGNIGMTPANMRRLKIVEILYLDARRKAVLIRRDNIEHLVIIGASGETVVETNIPVDLSRDVKPNA
jgi:flagellar protein FliO/FliZ